ncbi:hypothetical protein [Paracraurococcus lichenis]|uniref:Uncharacterized protein n=1 Tax=Paracraurococcus lichenis TaxID=3064888 RepID=A0ABT9E3W8_9PROT|nr:hypothetical protein [Paracraurococcus sp. LOR1-02]MDO9710859.1 hypothetical protein [Paracraurococcus sp. LOR1-02]
MEALFTRILQNAFVVAGLLVLAGLGFAALRLAEPAVACFLACGVLLMFKSSMAPDPKVGTAPQDRPLAGRA